MTTPGIIGSGAFGTALAISLALKGGPVWLWGRRKAQVSAMQEERENAQYLSGCAFPDGLNVTGDLQEICEASDTLLLAVPTQQLRAFLASNKDLIAGKTLVLCCKGIETKTGLLPHEVIASEVSSPKHAVLTGPSFAVDIGAGRPTALTLATQIEGADALQEALSTNALRLYLTDDLTGASLGGALKNVVALAAGMVTGAGLGESARAALMTRGFAEITRFATERGARPETLMGLSGFGDLILTCASTKSRNFAHGVRFAQGDKSQHGATVEGVMTAHAIAAEMGFENYPITTAVSALLNGDIELPDAMERLLARPLKGE